MPQPLNSINILGKEHTIKWCDHPSEVNKDNRRALWGEIDYWDASIRILRKDRKYEDLIQVLFHEVLHGIAGNLHLELNKDERHDELDIISLALTDVLIRNNLLNPEVAGRDCIPKDNP